jgi:hypothetical protein
LLVPELIAQWRGANLLCPSRGELWRQWLLADCIFGILCVFLGVLTAMVTQPMDMASRLIA